MTAETMGTRGGRGSSPEENAWVGERDNPWVSMGESPGPFEDITPGPRNLLKDRIRLVQISPKTLQLSY